MIVYTLIRSVILLYVFVTFLIMLRSLNIFLFGSWERMLEQHKTMVIWPLLLFSRKGLERVREALPFINKKGE